MIEVKMLNKFLVYLSGSTIRWPLSPTCIQIGLSDPRGGKVRRGKGTQRAAVHARGVSREDGRKAAARR